MRKFRISRTTYYNEHGCESHSAIYADEWITTRWFKVEKWKRLQYTTGAYDGTFTTAYKFESVEAAEKFIVEIYVKKDAPRSEYVIEVLKEFEV